MPVPVPVPVPDLPSPSPSASPPPPQPPSPDTIEVRGRPHARREANQTTIRAEQAKKVAGTQGDVLKVVQNLPGVSRPPVASGQIVVWGSAPRETRIYVDGVDIPALYHGSGLRSVINSDLVSSVDLVPGAFGAEYGRGLGGLVRVETRALPRGTHGYVGADTLDGSALVSTELSQRARIAVSARQSWLDRVLAVTSAPDVGDFFPIPRYRDGQIKATLDLRKRETLDAVLLGATDDLTRTVPSPDPASTRSEGNRTGFWRAYVRYTNVSENGDTAIVTPFFGRDSSELVQRFGPTPARLDIDTDPLWAARLAPLEARLDGLADDRARYARLGLRPLARGLAHAAAPRGRHRGVRSAPGRRVRRRHVAHEHRRRRRRTRTRTCASVL